MTPEQLLKPRYKVIADYPCSRFNVGDIFIEQPPFELCDSERKDDIKDYPHLFKRLEWWEERLEDEMPEYVKGKDGKVHRVSFMGTMSNTIIIYLINRLAGNSEFESYPLRASAFTPATLEEYEAYKKQLTA